MSRVLLALLIAVSGCNQNGGGGGDQSAKAVVPPVPADAGGKVLEVSGKVTVAGKPLKVGDALKPDDLIETGDDGKVVIELTHNLAHWELGANKSQKLDESIAWKLPKNEGNANYTITDMSAAGRPAERAAANSGTSAPTAPPAAEPAPAPSNAPAAPSAAAPPVKTAAPPPPPAPAKSAAMASPKADLEAPTGGPGGTRGIAGGQAGDIAANKAKLAAASDMVERKEPALRACLPMGSKVTLHVAIDATGKATTTAEGTTDANVIGCLRGVIATLSLPAEKTTVSMTIEKSTH